MIPSQSLSGMPSQRLGAPGKTVERVSSQSPSQISQLSPSASTSSAPGDPSQLSSSPLQISGAPG